MLDNNLDSHLDTLFQNATHLPSPPAVALRVLEFGEDPLVGMGEVAEVISNDPVLSARILKAANSPLYAARRPIDNLDQALNLLGMNTAITLALSFSLQPATDSGCIDKQTYWRRSVASAIAARVLCEQLRAGESGRFFVAALLQDIGMLVLEKAESERYTAIVEASDGHPALAQAEKECFGFDHALVGGRLLRSWRIPETICQAVSGSHAPGVDDTTEQESILERSIHFSGALADYCLLQTESRTTPKLLAEWAETHLSLDEEGFNAVLMRTAELMPEYAKLFEIRLVSDRDIAALLAEARDVLLLRNLKTLKEATAYKVRNDALESRNLALEQQSHTDPLTGLFNRTRMNAIISREFTAARTGGWPLSIGFIDVDNFKQINDGYGHPAGDAVLVSIAQEIKATMRECDTATRYGGEEFVVMLPRTSEADAFTVLEELRQRMAILHPKVDGTTVPITVSIGLASFNGGGLASEAQMGSQDDLIRAADRALYVAKHQGRNQTVIYGRTASKPTPKPKPGQTFSTT